MLYHVLSKDFESFYLKFKILRKFYSEFWETGPHPESVVSTKSLKIVILVLLYLKIENREREFEEMFQSLTPEIRTLPQVQKLSQFIDFLGIGNYNNAFELYAKETVEYSNVLGLMKALQKFE